MSFTTALGMTLSGRLVAQAPAGQGFTGVMRHRSDAGAST